MKDTRETAYRKRMTENNSQCRFRVGDKVLVEINGKIAEQVPHTIFWDKEFGGWMLACGHIGVHEQNFILVNERDQWTHHQADGLWSWWERK